MYVRVGPYGGQESPDALMLELQAVVSYQMWMLGTKLHSNVPLTYEPSFQLLTHESHGL